MNLRFCTYFESLEWREGGRERAPRTMADEQQALLQEIREQPTNQPRKAHYKSEHNVHVIHHVMLAS